MDCTSLEWSEKNGDESHPSPPANARHIDKKQKNTRPGGRKWYAHSHRSKENEEEGTITQKASRWKVHQSVKPKESDNTKLQEIGAANLMHTAAASSIGSRTFGTCYPGKYQELMLL